jgi:hypothetical protein
MSDLPQCVKVPYEHRHEAQKQANALMRKGKKKAIIYLCAHCDFYHITSQERDKPPWKSKGYKCRPR